MATVRPVQEMSNAEAALKAAKTLHADSLAPDLFRASTEYYYKAKREYRLKNFEVALRYAEKSRKFAEKAEFQSYLKGGAAPDAATAHVATEGAAPDPEAAIQKAHDMRSSKEAEAVRVEEEKREERNKKLRDEEPQLDEEEDQTVTEVKPDEEGKTPAAPKKEEPPK